LHRDLTIGFNGSPCGRDTLALARRLVRASGARPTVVTVYCAAR